MSAPSNPPAPSAATPPPDHGAEVVAQIGRVLDGVQRSLTALGPLRPQIQDPYQRLRALRDRLEECYDQAQADRLQAAALDFTADVDALDGVVKDLEAAAQRQAKAKEVIGYVNSALELAAAVVARVAPFL